MRRENGVKEIDSFAVNISYKSRKKNALNLPITNKIFIMKTEWGEKEVKQHAGSNMLCSFI